jgi:hypothetical protein
MVNVEKQVAHWLNSAKEDWEVANQLMEGRYADEKTPHITVEFAEKLRGNGEGMYQWLIKQL